MSANKRARIAQTPIEEFEYLIEATKRDEHGGKVLLPIDLAEKLLQLLTDTSRLVPVKLTMGDDSSVSR